MTAQLGAAIAKGFGSVAETMRDAPERDARLQEARTRQKMAEAQFGEWQQGAEMRQSQRELQTQQAMNELRQAQQQGAKAISYNAFGKYNGDQDVRHLNNMLTDMASNPIGSRMYAPWARFDVVTRTPENEKLVRDAGISDVNGFFENQQNPDEDNRTNFVIGIGKDGSKQILDMDKLYAASGYTNYMEQQELEMFSKRALAYSRLKQPGTSYQNLSKEERLANTLQEDDPSLTKSQAMQRAIEMLQKPGYQPSSETERTAQEIMKNNPGMGYEEAYSQAVAKKKGATVDQRETTEVEGARDQLDKHFEGGFFDADMTDPANRRAALPYISRIEKDKPLSTEDKRVARQLRQLTALGAKAGEEITDAETGIIDKTFNDIKSYFSNEVGGKEGTAAYETFRNTLRNMLFGATVSDGERNAFNQTMSDLKQQKGPVLARLKVQLQDVKNQLQSIQQFGDPYVSHYYLGMDEDQVDDVILAIDERLAMVDSVGVETQTPVSVEDFFKQQRGKN